MADAHARQVKEPPLTADIVFARLEELRALLRLTAFLSSFRPAAPRGQAAETKDAGDRKT